jgi:hypothetical protein
MWHEVVKVIKHFLKNLKTFDFRQVHNVLAFDVESMFQIFKGHEKPYGMWKYNLPCY